MRRFDTAGLEVGIGGEMADPPAPSSAGGRGAAHLGAALAEALASSALPRGIRPALLVATTKGFLASGAEVAARAPTLDPGLPARFLADRLAAQRGDRFEPPAAPGGFPPGTATISTACSSGTAALALAWARRGELEEGRYDALLCAGVDLLSDFVFRGFAALRAMDPRPCRPFDASRAGMTAAEAAAVLVLETPRAAAARGARVRGLLLGGGLGCDAVHPTAPSADGRGMAAAIAAAMGAAGTTAADLGHVHAHGAARPGARPRRGGPEGAADNGEGQHRPLLRARGARGVHRLPRGDPRRPPPRRRRPPGARGGMAGPLRGGGAGLAALPEDRGRLRRLQRGRGDGGGRAVNAPLRRARCAVEGDRVDRGPGRGSGTVEEALRALPRERARRLRRMDPPARAATLAAAFALEDAGFAPVPDGVSDRVLLWAATARGSEEEDAFFWETTLVADGALASPALFAATLPSAIPGEVARVLGLAGPAVVEAGRSAEESLPGGPVLEALAGSAELVLHLVLRAGPVPSAEATAIPRAEWRG